LQVELQPSPLVLLPVVTLLGAFGDRVAANRLALAVELQRRR